MTESNKRIKYLEEDLKAANAEAKNYLEQINFLKQELRNKSNDLTLIKYQLHLIKATLDLTIE